MSRRSQRHRAQLTVTATFAAGGGTLVCRTRNVSDNGVFLETPVEIDPGIQVDLSLLDEDRGEALELVGEITRVVPGVPGGAPGGLGVRLIAPPEAWKHLVQRIAAKLRSVGSTLPTRPARRLRVLVVGDEARRRGALALYVTSGWDVRFASDLDGATEALAGFRIDAVIAEHELDDPRWPPVLQAAQSSQPEARRLIRTSLDGKSAPAPGDRAALVHRVVDLDAGMDAVMDALTAEWPTQ